MANDVPEVQIGPSQPVEELAGNGLVYAVMGDARLSLSRVSDPILSPEKPGRETDGRA
jgi:hypothetical protein